MTGERLVRKFHPGTAPKGHRVNVLKNGLALGFLFLSLVTQAAIDTGFEYDTPKVQAYRKKIATACRNNPQSANCRGSASYCQKKPDDRFCGRGGRTDCSLFPFLKECGGTEVRGVSDRPDLTCQRYPYSPVCNSGFCRFNPGSIGCGDRTWGWQ